MSNKKNIFMLAGGNWRNPGSIKPVLKRILSHAGNDKPSVAYIGAANDDNSGFYKLMGHMIKTAGASVVKNIKLASEKADIKQVKNDLLNSDAVFLSGGDVERGMFWLERHNMNLFLRGLCKKGKLFFGLSAGSIMLGTKWVRWPDPKDDSSAELFDCTGIASVMCDTHAEKEKWIELKTAVLLSGEKGSGYGIPTGGGLCLTPEGSILSLEKPLVCYENKNNKLIETIIPVENVPK